jgi:hypothetical protein
MKIQFALARSAFQAIERLNSILTATCALRSLPCLAGALACSLLTSGCASPTRYIPAAYLENHPAAAVVIKRMPARPVMMDSGQGGIVGALVTGISRSSNMREQLAGINGDTMKESFSGEFNRLIGEHVTLNCATNDLRIEVAVESWGWFVPTGAMGIKLGEYQCQMTGWVKVFDVGRAKKVASTTIWAQKPLGPKPESTSARNAVFEVAQQFAAAAENTLIHGSQAVGGSGAGQTFQVAPQPIVMPPPHHAPAPRPH